MTRRILVLAFALATYAFFFLVVVWSVVFVGDLGFLKSVDSGAPTRSWVESGLVDVALIALFGIQHSVMARAPFKAWLTRRLPVRAPEPKTEPEIPPRPTTPSGSNPQSFSTN